MPTPGFPEQAKARYVPDRCLRALREAFPATVAPRDLRVDSGRLRRDESLRRLEERGLVEKRPGGWRATPPPPGAVRSEWVREASGLRNVALERERFAPKASVGGMTADGCYHG